MQDTPSHSQFQSLERSIADLQDRLAAVEPLLGHTEGLEERVAALEGRPEPDAFSTENKLKINGAGEVE